MKNKEDIKKIALELVKAGEDKKGFDTALLDLEGVSLLADYFIIMGANNSKQTQSIADAMEDKAAELGLPAKHTEGYREGQWILLDFGDIICHIFSGEDRENYNLEQLWSDAARVEV